MSTPAQSAHRQMRAPFGDYAKRDGSASWRHSPLPQSLGPRAWDELDAKIDREDYRARFLENDQQAERLQAQQQLQQQ
jgi:hypothetical protein